MDTVTAVSALPRVRLQTLVDALLEVHRALLGVVRIDFERTNGRVATSGELLGLLTEHEAFAWLRPLSSLVASIESASDDAEVAAAFAQARALFEPNDLTGDSFAAAYYAVLQRSPDVVMAHAALRPALH